MNSYVQAMLAIPANKVVRDNVMEALHAVPAEYRDPPPVKRAAALLAEQDKQLIETQKADGLFRWGSTWVHADQLAKLVAGDQTIQSQLASVQAESDRTQASIDSDDDQLRRTQQIWDSYNQLNPITGNVTVP